MAYETFIVERSGEIATVYFNRPDKLNPINEQVMREMLAITQELQEDDNSRVVILTALARDRDAPLPNLIDEERLFDAFRNFSRTLDRVEPTRPRRR